jgi:hypothetical protein
MIVRSLFDRMRSEAQKLPAERKHLLFRAQGSLEAHIAIP